MVSADLGKDVAVIQFDQGSFDKIKTLDYPENIILIFQPHILQNSTPLKDCGNSSKINCNGKIAQPID
ncbi:hypothetical protein [Anabaena azotica]|uniref:Uncharacterized protein n=1 Tax=Anabaena azotica FACHB-119 TaxID=947527 RepID=A0ABR8DEU3_9NOST|nr:hypothetical protein [Anabaena azotica]MBD2505629.1 hypothetical protein [Anabaena azotica FACHB-119]